MIIITRRQRFGYFPSHNKYDRNAYDHVSSSRRGPWLTPSNRMSKGHVVNEWLQTIHTPAWLLIYVYEKNSYQRVPFYFVFYRQKVIWVKFGHDYWSNKYLKLYAARISLRYKCVDIFSLEKIITVLYKRIEELSKKI